MANMNIRTPRFYVDWISHLLARGVPQNGNFDVYTTGSNKIGIQTGTEAELFDMKPLNKVDFNTSLYKSQFVVDRQKLGPLLNASQTPLLSVP